MPFLCQSSAIVKNFLPCLLRSKPLQAMYTVKVLLHVRPYMRLQFSLCISCCLKMQDFYKNVCFCTRTRSFVVLCIMVAPPVDKICSRYQLSPQTLSTVGLRGFKTLLCRVHFSHQSEIQSFVCQYPGADLYILSGDNVIGFGGYEQWNCKLSGAQKWGKVVTHSKNWNCASVCKVLLTTSVVNYL